MKINLKSVFSLFKLTFKLTPLNVNKAFHNEGEKVKDTNWRLSGGWGVFGGNTSSLGQNTKSSELFYVFRLHSFLMLNMKNRAMHSFIQHKKQIFAASLFKHQKRTTAQFWNFISVQFPFIIIKKQTSAQISRCSI